MDLEGHQKLENFQNVIHIPILIFIKKILGIFVDPLKFSQYLYLTISHRLVDPSGIFYPAA